MQYAKHEEIIEKSNHHIGIGLGFSLVLKWVHHRSAQMVSNHAEASRKSFIDTEYEKFKEIEKQSSTKTKVAELAQEKSFYGMPSAEKQR